MDLIDLRARARRFESSADLPPLRDVWSIEDEELSPIGLQTLEQFNSAIFRDSVSRLAVTGQALEEFVDLQDMIMPRGGGKFFNINFFYFESLAALRESVLVAINGCFHASFAVLRSAFEMFVLHAWWKLTRRDEQNYSKFYDWFHGRANAPGLGRVLPECYADRPVIAPTAQEARDVYARLCSYAHKPNFHESITVLRGSTDIQQTTSVLMPWLELIASTLRLMLDLAVRSAPQCLFPIEITRKFGFNPPVGIFFDESNAFPLVTALGEQAISQYREHFCEAEPPRAQLDWARAWPDLTDEQILATWGNDELPLPKGKSAKDVIRKAEMISKAKMRCATQILAYKVETPTLPDLSKIFDAAGLDGELVGS